MGIGKEIDELGNGVIGRYGVEHVMFMNPPEGVLITCHFHPYRVDGINRNGSDIGHYKMLPPIDHQRIDWHVAKSLCGQLLDDGHGVGTHQEVVVLGVVVGGVERDAVQLLLSQIPGIRCLLTTIVAGS